MNYIKIVETPHCGVSTGVVAMILRGYLITIFCAFSTLWLFTRRSM